MQRFLQFIVEETLAGRSSQIGEYGIGVAVFDRGADFEPMLDPIVRNDARRLRFKLLEYYRLTPVDPADSLIIDIPKGGYVPAFHRHSPQEDPVPAPSEAVRRLAVLPFDVISSAPETALAGRALSLSLTAGLTNLKGLEAVATGCLRECSLREAASELRLSHVIHGSIIESGNRCRIIVNLIYIPNGTQLWAREYHSESGSTIAFQSELSREITADVTAHLGLAQPEPLKLVRAA
ncbi:hypothetical protein [Paludibaculum fermentans]|uniref:hypothetical protein n=1 Tax=Paludibaculum fermentans TaxID=1473598 RepID=UPI003EBF278B